MKVSYVFGSLKPKFSDKELKNFRIGNMSETRFNDKKVQNTRRYKKDSIFLYLLLTGVEIPFPCES